MATQDYYTGFDFLRVGSFSFTAAVTSPAAHSDAVTFSSGTYSHIDFSGLMGAGKYEELADAIQTYLNSLGGTRPTYTVTFNTALMQYSFSVSAGTLALTFSGAAGTIAKHTLGISANVGATSSPILSDRRPYYAIRSKLNGQSAFSFPYEPDLGVAEDEADDGTSYSISRTTCPRYLDWEQRMETANAPSTTITAGALNSGAGVRITGASTEVPFTWEHMIKHARGAEPFALYDEGSGTGYLCKLRREAATFRPAIVAADYSDLWNMPFKTRLISEI